MGGSQKSKRVTWPSDDNLCQVRLFLSEDSPAQVGFGSQDHLQAKTWPSHSNFMVSDDNLPPGFEGTQPANLQWNKLPQIPLIKWRCPPRFLLDEAWRVAAGDESIEVEIENDRVKKLLEAIYPRESAIPPDPSGLMDLEDSFTDDKPPLLIPITPIEDEDAPAPAPSEGLVDSVVINTPPMSLQAQPVVSVASSSSYALTTTLPPQGVLATEVIPGVDPAVVSAANAALSAVMASNSQGNLIDRDLLIKILSDPKMVEQLVKSHGASASTQILPATSAQNMPTESMQTMVSTSSHSMPATKAYSVASTITQSMMGTSTQNRPRPMTPGISFSDPSPISVGRPDRHLAHISRAEQVAPPVAATSGGVFYPPPSRIAPIPNPRSSAPEIVSAPSQPLTKDINYYKNLIQQHGGDRQETMPQYGSRSNHHLLPVREQPSNNAKSRDLKPKIMKPCIYFNTARGCRNGANCAYQHDESAQQRVSGLPDSQSAKRLKMDREITGT